MGRGRPAAASTPSARAARLLQAELASLGASLVSAGEPTSVGQAVDRYAATARRVCEIARQADDLLRQPRTEPHERGTEITGLLMQLFGLMPEFPSQRVLREAPHAVWLDRVVQTKVTAVIAALLDLIQDLYPYGSEMPNKMVACMFSAADALNGIHDAAWETPPAGSARRPADLTSLEVLRSRLLGQMADPEVVQRLCRIPAFVMMEVWPWLDRVAGQRSSTHADARSGDILARLHPRHKTILGVVVLGDSLLSAVIGWLTCVIQKTQSAGGIGGSALPRRQVQQFLATVTRTRLVAGLCTATLAGPHCTGVLRLGLAFDGDERTAADASLAMPSLVSALGELLCFNAFDWGGAYAAAFLDAPEVRQFRLATLRQLAAAADQFGLCRASLDAGPGGLAAAAVAGRMTSALTSWATGSGASSDSLGRAGGSPRTEGATMDSASRASASRGRADALPRAGDHGAGGGTDGSLAAPVAAPVAVRWDLLDLVNLRSAYPTLSSEHLASKLAFHASACIPASVGIFQELRAAGKAKEADRLAAQLLPNRLEAAAMGAAVMRTMRASVSAIIEYLRCQKGKDGGTAEGTPHGQSPPSADQRFDAAMRAHVPGMVEQAGHLMHLVLVFRMFSAPREEAEAVLPDLLEMVACVLDTVAVALEAVGAEVLGPHVATGDISRTGDHGLQCLGWLLQGQIFEGPSRQDEASEEEDLEPSDNGIVWTTLSSEAQAASVMRLASTDLLHSLDVLLRHSAARGGGQLHAGVQEQQQQQSWNRHPVFASPMLPNLLGPLMHQRLVRWREQHRRQADVSGGDSRHDGCAADRQPRWRVHEEVGLLITALKLMRREVARVQDRASAGQAEGQQQPAQRRQGEPRDPSCKAGLDLSVLVSVLGVSDVGLPRLLRELLKDPDSTQPVAPRESRPFRDRRAVTRARVRAARHHGAVAAAEPSTGNALAPRRRRLHSTAAADAEVVAQAIVASCVAVLPYNHHLLESSISESLLALAVLRRLGGRPAGLSKHSAILQMIVYNAIDAVADAAEHLPSEMLLAAAPQRTLAAVGMAMLVLQQLLSKREEEVDWENVMNLAGPSLLKALTLLSADERLLEGCVPGWLWATAALRNRDCIILHPVEQPGESAGDEQLTTVEELSEPQAVDPVVCWRISSLCEEYGTQTAVHGSEAAVAKMKEPVATLLDSRWARFDAWDWTSTHEAHQRDVAALAREMVARQRYMEWSAWRQLTAVASDGKASGEMSAAGGEGIPSNVCVWPPRLLRLCANPVCGDYSGGSEAGLKLRWCSKCFAVRYCSGACQIQHWPRHKTECAGWAGRWQPKG